MFTINLAYHQMMISLELPSTLFAFIAEHRRMDRIAVCSKYMWRFEFLWTLIAWEISSFKMCVPMVGHVTLRSEPFTAYITHVFTNILEIENWKFKVKFFFVCDSTFSIWKNKIRATYIKSEIFSRWISNISFIYCVTSKNKKSTPRMSIKQK